MISNGSRQGRHKANQRARLPGHRYRRLAFRPATRNRYDARLRDFDQAMMTRICQARLSRMLFPFAILALVACEGAEIPLGGGVGGEEEEEPVDPPGAGRIGTTNNPYGINQVRLAWGRVDGAAYYYVLRRDKAGAGYERVSDQVISANPVIVYVDVLPTHLTDWNNLSYALESCNVIAGEESCTDGENVYAPSRVATTTGTTGTGVVAYGAPSEPRAGDQAGWSMALSADGSTLVAGTSVMGDEGIAGTDLTGRVYVFIRAENGLDWTEQAILKAEDEDVFSTALRDSFGFTAALSADGNTLAIGAPEAFNSATIRVGRVYLFTRDGAEWTQQAILEAPNAALNARFGHAVAVSGDGNTLAVGSPQESNGATGSGAAYIFTRDAEGWSSAAYLKAESVKAGAQFGAAIALSGNGATLAVGTPQEDGGGQGSNVDPFDDCAEADSVNCALDSGAVYIYTRNNNTIWARQAYLKASNTGAGDAFGYALALSTDGNDLAVGAPLEDSNASFLSSDDLSSSAAQGNDDSLDSGAVYLFRRSGAIWAQQVYLKAHNTVGFNTGTPGVGDRFGHALALSGNGTIVAVGAPQESSNGTGMASTSPNGLDSSNTVNHGAVYVYALADEFFSFIKETRAVDHASDSRFGHDVVLSEDGFTLAIGSPGNTCTRPRGVTNVYPIQSTDPSLANNCTGNDSPPGGFYIY
jgi:hypothetical protein